MVRESEAQRADERERVFVQAYMCVCVCVCARARERESEKESDRRMGMRKRYTRMHAGSEQMGKHDHTRRERARTHTRTYSNLAFLDNIIGGRSLVCRIPFQVLPGEGESVVRRRTHLTKVTGVRAS